MCIAQMYVYMCVQFMKPFFPEKCIGNIHFISCNISLPVFGIYFQIFLNGQICTFIQITTCLVSTIISAFSETYFFLNNKYNRMVQEDQLNDEHSIIQELYKLSIHLEFRMRSNSLILVINFKFNCKRNDILQYVKIFHFQCTNFNLFNIVDLRSKQTIQ